MVFSLGEEEGSLFVGKGWLEHASPVPEPPGVILVGQSSLDRQLPETRPGPCPR
jgi:hypothetical protein